MPATHTLNTKIEALILLDQAARLPAHIWHSHIRPILAKTRAAALACFGSQCTGPNLIPFA